MRRTAVAALLFAVATATAADPPLVGLWAARRNFGPDVRGPLEIDRDGKAWRAHIAGRSATVTIDGSRVSFALPNGEGRFRGAIAGSAMRGHWVQPRGVSTGFEFATPVTLQRKPDGRWQGEVTPIDDHMTIYLPIAVGADGRMTGYLRNPERNFGRFTDVQHVTLDGNRVRLLGKDSTALVEGTYDAESDTISLSIPWRGGTYDFHRATAADEAAFYPRGKVPAPYVYRKPSARDDGWPVASVDDVGIDRQAIASFINILTATPMDSVHASDVHAFLLARHGKLVVEEYFHGTSPDEPHDTRSAAKSAAAVLAGAAMLHGEPVRASMRAYEAMYGKAAASAVDPRKQAITLENLLTMSAGVDCDDADEKSPGNEDTMQEQTAQPDWYRYTLDLRMIREPGEKAVYCSVQPNLAGGVLGRATGEWLPDLFRQRIAAPLQIRRYGLNLTPTGDAYLGGGMRFLPRDFMKLGQVMIGEGRWNGRQIVSAEWAKRSASPLFEMRGRRYGYLWWVDEVPYQGRTVQAFMAGGNGGQVVMGIPELDLVIAFFGGNYSDPVLFLPQRVFVPKHILPAVK